MRKWLSRFGLVLFLGSIPLNALLADEPRPENAEPADSRVIQSKTTALRNLFDKHRLNLVKDLHDLLVDPKPLMDPKERAAHEKHLASLERTAASLGSLRQTTIEKLGQNSQKQDKAKKDSEAKLAKNSTKRDNMLLGGVKRDVKETDRLLEEVDKEAKEILTQTRNELAKIEEERNAIKAEYVALRGEAIQRLCSQNAVCEADLVKALRAGVARQTEAIDQFEKATREQRLAVENQSQVAQEAFWKEMGFVPSRTRPFPIMNVSWEEVKPSNSLYYNFYLADEMIDSESALSKEIETDWVSLAHAGARDHSVWNINQEARVLWKGKVLGYGQFEFEDSPTANSSAGRGYQYFPRTKATPASSQKNQTTSNTLPRYPWSERHTFLFRQKFFSEAALLAQKRQVPSWKGLEKVSLFPTDKSGVLLALGPSRAAANEVIKAILAGSQDGLTDVKRVGAEGFQIEKGEEYGVSYWELDTAANKWVRLDTNPERLKEARDLWQKTLELVFSDNPLLPKKVKARLSQTYAPKKP